MQRALLITAVIAIAFGAWSFLQQQAPQQSPQPEAIATVYATDLSGADLDIRAGTGKPKLLNFWASWCRPCVEELPLLEAYAADHSNALEIIAVAIDTLPHVKTFLEKYPLTLPVAVGTISANELMTEWGNDKSILPFSALLDAEGNLLKVHAGPFDKNSLDQIFSN